MNSTDQLKDEIIKGRVDIEPWKPIIIDKKTCFVCQKRLIGNDETKEDLIPNWAIREKEIRETLIDTYFPGYENTSDEKLLVPACRKCNNENLSKIEIAVSEAYRKGINAIRALPENTLRSWLAKINFGSVYDLSLKQQYGTPALNLFHPQHFAYLHFLLQEARGKIVMPNGHSTFFIFECQTTGCGHCDYDLAIPFGDPYLVMLKLNNIVIMGAVNDHGLLKVLNDNPAFIAAKSIKLHKEQVRSLWSIFLDAAQQCQNLYPQNKYLVHEEKLYIDYSPVDVEKFRKYLNSSIYDDKKKSLILSYLIKVDYDTILKNGGPEGYLVDQFSNTIYKVAHPHDSKDEHLQ